MKFRGIASPEVALKLAAVLDEEGTDVNTNPDFKFTCSQCDGVLSYHRGDVRPHFEHQRGYAAGGDVKNHKPR